MRRPDDAACPAPRRYPSPTRRVGAAVAAALALLATLAGCATRQRGREGAEAFVAREEPRPLPNVSFVDAEGRERTLADFRGKAVLLNLWASWCVPCAKEMPALDRLAARRGGSDFEVVALSIDKKGLAAARAFHEALGLQAIEPYADSARQALFLLGPRALPTTFLLDALGREVARAQGARRWDSPEVVAEIERRLNLDGAATARASTARGASLAQAETD
jgi:thiol-disulfide isomerase/thioredoxin